MSLEKHYRMFIWITSWKAWFVETFGSLHYWIKVSVLDVCNVWMDGWMEKDLQRNLDLGKLFCMDLWTKSLKYTCEWILFVSVCHSSGYICNFLQAVLLKCLISGSVNHVLETPSLFTWYIMTCEAWFKIRDADLKRKH